MSALREMIDKRAVETHMTVVISSKGPRDPLPNVVDAPLEPVDSGLLVLEVVEFAYGLEELVDFGGEDVLFDGIVPLDVPFEGVGPTSAGRTLTNSLPAPSLPET